MKHILLTLLITVSGLGTNLMAQNGLSVNAMCFRGSGNEVHLGIDYRVNGFSLGIGLAYMSSQVQFDPDPVFNFPMSAYKKRYIFRHLMLPVELAWHLPVGSRFSLIPAVNTGIGYNTSMKYMTWQDHYLNLYERKISQEEFDQSYKRISLWAGFSARLAYRVTERISILAALQGRFMITPVNKKTITGSGQQYGNSIGAGAGVQYYF